MSGTKLLLNAYYEALHERLEAKKELLLTRIKELILGMFLCLPL
jgi:hypothetical protein